VNKEVKELEDPRRVPEKSSKVPAHLGKTVGSQSERFKVGSDRKKQALDRGRIGTRGGKGKKSSTQRQISVVLVSLEEPRLQESYHPQKKEKNKTSERGTRPITRGVGRAAFWRRL